jgi:hypothetical protein
MTTQPAQAVLDPFAARQMFATLSHPAGASAQDITELRAESLAWLAELAPRDRVQSALAVHVIAFHHAMLHHLAQTVQGEISGDLGLRHAGRAVTATRMMDRALAALLARQTMAPMRAVTLPAGIEAELAVTVPEVEVPEVEAVPEVEVPQAEAVPASEAAAPPQEADAPPAAAPPASADAPEPVGSSGWVAERLRDLEVKLARGEALTAAQQDWQRRQLARQAKASAAVLAA